MVSLPYRPTQCLGPLLIALLAILGFLFSPYSNDWFAYDRYAIEGFETWRLISGNIVHTNGFHLLLNLAGLILLWALHGDHYRIGLFLKLFVWCCLGTSLGIYFFSPSLIWYAGLSGALHGVFIWGACMDIRMGIKSGWLLLAGIVFKLGMEQWQGSSAELAELIDANVAVDAHLYGAISGLALFLVMWALSRPAQK
ncbi:rhombosortase [Alteromonas aestuariivivens]|uniref:Rhombosortase n=1 Tax=Alteromonas aestuariivivens TaxID=1938339 RepID=A0A3D8MD38_9ALTE|nr:rhombosortase [Alteromonas aestuariivivens]